jgi:hypothetical protein
VSLQIVGSRYRIYAKRQAPWAIPHETAKAADVEVVAPQITEKAFDAITIQSEAIFFEHRK